MLMNDYVRGFIVGYVRGYVDGYVDYCMVYDIEFDGQRILDSQESNMVCKLLQQEVVDDYVYQDDTNEEDRRLEVINFFFKTVNEVVEEVEENIQQLQQPKRRIRF